MRNLKKILALVLALVMSLSLMATAGAADFADASSISDRYETAVNVLEGLKVFKGYAEDNTFRPQGDITRAEVATIIYRIATGDVEDAQASIYTNMTTSFTDLNEAEWARGYVNYSHNAQIIKGEGGGKFNPNGKISGYATLAMILRAIGYGKNGEFEGTQWEITTAAKAKEIGLIDNVMEAQLGSNATREMVAEILFRGLLVETVTYNALTGYVPTGKTLGQNVGLEEVTGVVVANEWASLVDTKPLKEGTLLKVDGKNRMVDVSTSGAEIGTSVHVYLKGEKVLAGVEDAGNDIRTNEGADITVNKLKGGLVVNSTTQHFVNYDKQTTKTSDWRIEYKAPKALVDGSVEGALKYTDAQLTKNKCTLKDGVWSRVIRVGDDITAMDLAIMREIFHYDNAEIDGEVYVGTDDKDESNELSWNQFVDKYLALDENAAIEEAERGNSLRIIDNNGDGVAEYVLLTNFVMTVVTDYEERTATYTVEYEEADDGIKGTEIEDADMVKADGTDLSVGSVVLYAKVDGVYYIGNPVVDTQTIDKRSINAKAETFTVDGETYTWSEIKATATGYYDDIQDIQADTYDLYLDYFGYVRLATEPSKGFALLTDAYYWTNRRTAEYKADLYIGNEFVEETDVIDDAETMPNGDGFVDTTEGGDNGNRGTWERLNTFGEFYWREDTFNGTTYYNYIDKYARYLQSDDGDERGYCDPFYTNVAAYTEDDGVYVLYDVNDISTINGLRKPYHTYEIAGTYSGTVTASDAVAAYYGITDNNVITPAAYESGLSHIARGSVKARNQVLYGITNWVTGTHIHDGDLQRINTNGSTTYYFVANPGTSKQAVTSWVGYQNVPAELGNFTAMRAYAVTHEVAGDTSYEIADVVVFEGMYGETVDEAALIVNALSDKREESLGRREDGTFGDKETTFGAFRKDQLSLTDDDEDGLRAPQVVFYKYDDKGDGEPVLSKYEKYGIYAGEVVTLTETKNDDYIQISLDGKGEGTRDFKTFYTSDVETYELHQLTKHSGHARYNLEWTQTERIQMGDKLIVMCDGKGEVKLAVNVTKSWVDNDKKSTIAKLNELFADVVEDYNEIDTSKLDINVKTIKGQPVVNGEAHLSYKQSQDPEVLTYVAEVVGYKASDAPTLTVKLLNDVDGGEDPVAADDKTALASVSEGDELTTVTLAFTAYDKDNIAITKNIKVVIDKASNETGIVGNKITVKGHEVTEFDEDEEAEEGTIAYKKTVELTAAEAESNKALAVLTPVSDKAEAALDAENTTVEPVSDDDEVTEFKELGDTYAVAIPEGEDDGDIVITVTAENGDVATYTITVTIQEYATAPTDIAEVAGKSSLSKKTVGDAEVPDTLTVAKGVDLVAVGKDGILSTESTEKYLTVTDDEDSGATTTVKSVTATTITLVTKENGKADLETEIKWENEILRLEAGSSVVKTPMPEGFDDGDTDGTTKIVLAATLDKLVDPTVVYDLEGDEAFTLISQAGEALAEIHHLSIAWAWKDGHAKLSNEYIGKSDVVEDDTDAANTLAVTVTAYDADGNVLGTLVLNPVLSVAAG